MRKPIKSQQDTFPEDRKNMTIKAGVIPVIKFLDKLGFNLLLQKNRPSLTGRKYDLSL